MIAKREGHIITFYSYKGGTGRSMALANVAWILAANRKRVFVIDWDLEAPGLHRYFKPFLIDKELTSSNGLIDIVHSYVDQTVAHLGVEGPLQDGEIEKWVDKFADIAEEAISLDVNIQGGGIDFLPAGCQVSSYAQQVNTFSWHDFYQRFGGGVFLEAVKRRLKESYDYILIDSRTGVSDTSGICTAHMPDSLVVCFTYNNQSIAGAAAIARSARETHRQFSLFSGIQGLARLGSPDFRVYPVPTRVDLGEREKLRSRQEYARKEFDDLLDHIPEDQRADYWSNVEIPYNTFHAYEEVLATLADDPNDPKLILGASLRLTSRLTLGKIQEFQQLLPLNCVSDILREFSSTPYENQSEKPNSHNEIQIPETVADQHFQGLPGSEQLNARRLWTMLVDVRPSPHGDFLSVALVIFEQLDDELRKLAHQMVQSGLLKLRKDLLGKETLEIAHESLLRNWKTLLDWIKVDKKFLLWRTHLSDRRREWESNQRNPSLLLYHTSLDQALAWRRRIKECAPEDQNYIQESEDWSQRAWNRRYNNLSKAFVLGASILIIAPIATALYQAKVADELRQSLLPETLHTRPDSLEDTLTSFPQVRTEASRREQIQITYFKKNNDPQNLETRISKLGYRFRIATSKLDTPTNTVWFGCEAPLTNEDAITAIITLIEAGVVIRKLEIFPGENRSKPLIQIGAQSAIDSDPALSIEYLLKFDLERRCKKLKSGK